MLIATCAPPSTRDAAARLASEVPDTITSMKAFSSHGTPHQRIDAQQRRDQRAGDGGEPSADAERQEADAFAIDAEALGQGLVHDDGSGRQAKRSQLEDGNHEQAEAQRNTEHDQAIERILGAEQDDGAFETGLWTKLVPRPKASVMSWTMTMPSPQVARIASSGRP